MRKLISVLLLLCLLMACISTAGAADIQLKAPEIKVDYAWDSETSTQILYAGEPLYVYFHVTGTGGEYVNDQNVVAKYTVTRDSDGADVTVIPKMNAVERTTNIKKTVRVTDGKSMTPGTYTIKVKAVCTYKGYKDSAETTKQITVSTKTRPTADPVVKITNGRYETGTSKFSSPQFRIGEQITAAITAVGATECKVYCEGKEYPVTLTNGAGTFTSDPLKDGDYDYIQAFFTYPDHTAYVDPSYGIFMDDVTISFDKKSYNVGETATITLHCADAEYFQVRLSYEEKLEDRDREEPATALYYVKYLATSGNATITVPVTEAGWLSIFVYAQNDTYHISNANGEYIQVDSPENIRYIGEESERDIADELAAPTGLTILPGANGGLALSWNAAPNATDYDVYTASSATGVFKLLATVHGTTYTDYAAPAKQVVYYRVVSKRMTADGRWENTADPLAAPFKSYMMLSKPRLKVKVKTAKTLAMSWKKIKEADYYEVYYSTKSAAPVATTKANLTVKNGVKVDAKKKVKGGKTYYCYVRAVKQLSDGTKVVGPWSKVVKKKAKK